MNRFFTSTTIQSQSPPAVTGANEDTAKSPQSSNKLRVEGKEPDELEDSRRNVVHITPLKGSKQPLAAQKELFGRDPFYFCMALFFPINYSCSLCQNCFGVTETNPNLFYCDLKAQISPLLIIKQISDENAAHRKTAQPSLNPGWAQTDFFIKPILDWNRDISPH